MKLSAGSDKLRVCSKNLWTQWEETKDSWKDSVRNEFEENHLVPLQDQTRALLTAISLFAQTLDQAERDCVE